MSAAGRASRAPQHALFVLLPVIATVWLVHQMVVSGIFAIDFRREFWVAGFRVLHDGDPYGWSAQQIAARVSFPYPALTAIAFAPWATLSRGVSEAAFVAICVLAALATLRLLSVTDWRLYGVVLLWPGVVAAWQAANLTLLLALVLAGVWRWRDRPAVAGALAALAVSLKPFTWPIWLWLLATRRFRAAGWALAAGLALNAASWAVLGFGAIGRYVRLSGEVTRALDRSGYGVISLATHLGASPAAATALEVILSVALGSACVIAGRRRREQEALTLAVALMLVASPLVWSHYLALLLVPIAIARPQLGPVWAVALVLWICPAEAVRAWQIVLAWVVCGGLLLAILRRPTLRAGSSPRSGAPGPASTASNAAAPLLGGASR
jgi:hypothetical protein